MKRILALFLALTVVALLCACGGETNPKETTTESTSTNTKIIEIEENVLKSSIGQADENGVYTVPNNITEIGELCFYGDNTLKKIIIPESVRTICSGAFAGCVNLVEVVMADSVTALGSHAFYGCTSLEKVTLSNSLEKIPAMCFNSCTSIEEITIPQGVKTICHDAFGYCSSLSAVDYPSTLESIDDNAFVNCIGLTSIDLSAAKGLKTLGNGVFNGCMYAKSIVLPNGLETIGASVFSNCTAVTKVTIPSTVKTIGAYAFNHTAWYVENTDDYLIVGDGVLIRCGVNAKNLDLSNKGIKVIGGAAFWNAELQYGTSAKYGYKYAGQLKNVEIPEGVVEIGDRAFYYCMSLTDVKLPSTLERIGDGAFDFSYAESTDTGYYAAVDIDISNCKNLKYIGENAFYGCSEMSDISIPDGIEYIGKDAFCMTKAYVDFYTGAEAKGGNECSFYINNGVLLWTYVPTGAEELNVPAGVRMMAGGACCGWDSVMVLTSTDGLTPYWLTKYNITYGIKSVTLPDGLETIGDYGLYYIGKLEKLDMPDTVKKIGFLSFGRLEALAKIHMSDSLETIGQRAFWYCTSFVNVTLPDSVKNIDSNAFYDCGRLKILRMPEGTENIGTAVFSASCTELDHIYLPQKFKCDIYDILETPSMDLSISYYIPEK
ncbi:MAG: leucine-rich repeat domain-containing protein [Clostridia bacterium]|nr:leucine-rich repeat domain-containing protein [Clostridia bacterium]